MTVKCTPKKKNRRHMWTAIAFTAVAIISALFITLKLGNQLVFQVLTIGATVGLTWCLIRFYISEKTYTLTDHYGPMMLLITQSQGKRTKDLFEVKLSDVIKIGRLSKKGIESRHSGTFYDYRVTMGAEEYQYLLVRRLSSRIVLLIEADSKFFDVLESECNTAAALRYEDDYGEDEEN